ncbi:MAG: ABC transporter ATP-binding protein [Paramuribaculum sp.]|nr:ABC transporter ATP-binding protein [Paramuribaculum sp.]MDE6488781.1 ABC transporter ATP-binding protein [Paramuribaculum sp.]
MIEVKNLTKSFDRLRVLKGIDMHVSSGEIVSIVGPSGAGKTTLLQIIGSLDRPDSGSVRFEGQDIFSLSDKQLARFRNTNIGFIFQFHQLLPEFTLLENVAMPALIGGSNRSDAMDRSMELLDYLDLKDRASHKPTELSGGERQRGAVARALINRPTVILADEPSGSLDSRNRDELHRLFFDLRRDMGQSFIIVTHDESLARMADRMITMRDGTITSINVREEKI